MIRTDLWGHGFGGRLDLPVPVSYFAAGAAVVLIVTFFALAALWRTPRLQDGPRHDSTGARPPIALLRVVGIVSLVLALLGGLAAAVTGQDGAGTRNIAPVLVWVFFWLLVPFAGAVLGNLYTGINPWRSLAGWLGLGRNEKPEAAGQLGVWPAAFGLVAFAWLELIYTESALPVTVALAALAYTVFLLTASSRLGTETALTSFDVFTSYNRLVSAIAPFGRNDSGRLVRRGWLRALPVIPEWPGLAAFVCFMIATVSFDGISNTLFYDQVAGTLGRHPVGRTVILLGTCGMIGGAYALACWAAVRLGGSTQSTGTVALRFAHTLVPIAFAYAFAHYFTLVIFEGQSIVSAISDPFGLGWDLFGTRDYKINFFLGAIPVWYIQVGTIVLGHVAGVVLAHDRALADFKGIGAVRSQYAMLVLMVLLTGLGLFILAG